MSTRNSFQFCMRKSTPSWLDFTNRIQAQLKTSRTTRKSSYNFKIHQSSLPKFPSLDFQFQRPTSLFNSVCSLFFIFVSNLFFLFLFNKNSIIQKNCFYSELFSFIFISISKQSLRCFLNCDEFILLFFSPLQIE